MQNFNSEIINVNQYIFKHKQKFNIEIGGELKEIRKQRNISLEELASRTMMAPSYIAQIEKGVNGITLSKFIMICNALEIKPQEILTDFLYLSYENQLYEEFQCEKNIIKNISYYLKHKRNV